MTPRLVVKLTAEDIAKLQTKELANAIRKLHAGKTLTSAERALIAQAGVGGELSAPSGFAQTWDELGRRLAVSRRAIQEWRRDPRYMADCPVERADGRHDVAAWGAFMVRHGLKRADEGVESRHLEDDEESDFGTGPGVLQVPRVGGTAVDWKKANLALDHRRKNNEILTQEGTLLVAADLEVPMGALLAALQTKLTQFAPTVAPVVTGRRDVPEVEDILAREMDSILTELNAARFLEISIRDLAAALPFNPESERLMSVVTFDGQDRGALLELIATVAIAALAQIGSKVIARARLKSADVGDAETGQVIEEAAAGARAEQSQREPLPEPVQPASEQPDRRAESGGEKPGKNAVESAKPHLKKARQRKLPAKPAAAPRDVEPIKVPRPPRNARRSRR